MRNKKANEANMGVIWVKNKLQLSSPINIGTIGSSTILQPPLNEYVIIILNDVYG